MFLMGGVISSTVTAAYMMVTVYMVYVTDR